ncbi:NEL-type E3 ubiquitin ligase domain-containing protein [Pseudomonas palleroniana]
MPDVTRPAVSSSIHGAFLTRAIPPWFSQARLPRQQALADHPLVIPTWYIKATAAQKSALAASHAKYRAIFNQVDATLATIQDVQAFAEPLLKAAIKERFKLDIDVRNVYLARKFAPAARDDFYGFFSFDRTRTSRLDEEYRGVSLLEVALANFLPEEEHPARCADCEIITGWSDYDGEVIADFAAVNSQAKPIAPAAFATLCRSLDLGRLYQQHIKAILQPRGVIERQALAGQLQEHQRRQLALSTEIARQQFAKKPDSDLVGAGISSAVYQMLKQVLAANAVPTLDSRPVTFANLQLLGVELVGPLLIGPSRIRAARVERLVVYLPDDPQQPLKEYANLYEFLADLGGRLKDTEYRRYFSRFVPVSEQGEFFRQLNALYQASRLRQPPDWRMGEATIKGDLWQHRYQASVDKILADARAVAVPTDDEDAKARAARVAGFKDAVVSVFNLASFVVPGLGPIMLAVGAVQMCEEVYEGIEAYEQSETREMWAHVSSIALNVAMLATGATVLPQVQMSGVVDALRPVIRADGKQKLWRADLSAYHQDLKLEGQANPLGQYAVAGKHYLRLGDKVVEHAFDESTQRWRIQHPSDALAYQPPLVHNGAGAWRQVHEQPLAWDRLTLLRRMGPSVDGYSDAALLRAADISGVSDNSLRKMHLDNAAPPPELADTLRLFEAERGVQQVLAQLEGKQPIDERYLYAPALVCELPRWPVGRVLQVFENAELSGPSIQYGSQHLPSGSTAKAPIKISRADVLGGQLPARLLASLDEEDITRLLGGEPARVEAARPEELRKQLAYFARTRQPALFESLYQGRGAKDPDVQKLRRLTPGLSESAARSVLDHASAEELTRLRTARAPLQLLEQSRWHARHGRISRALAGLHMDNLAATDSKRLALHALGQLPGWPNDLRLEIRDGSIEGRLIAGVGDKAATQRKYLVKKGPSYQAFNERGETLNSVSRDNDNFYPSLMHALPDAARQALGIADVARSAELRQAIIEYALAHPADAVQVLDKRLPRLRPPQRISRMRVGYPASGRGEGQVPALLSRVREIYPELTERQANGFVLEQLRAGKTNAQILSLLDARLSEWQRLEAALDQWVATRGGNRRSKQSTALSIKESWRNAPLAAEDSRYTLLNIWAEDRLPALLDADFSHVRKLRISGDDLTDRDINQMLERFPKVRELRLDMPTVNLPNLPSGVHRLPELRELTLYGLTQFEPQAAAELARLVNLHSLKLHRVLTSFDHLDVRPLTQLRELTISDTHEGHFPEGALDLPQLGLLDLQYSTVRQLPARLLRPGHEKLWGGLSLDWSKLTRETFKPAYEFIKKDPDHDFDLEQMVSLHALGQIQRMGEFVETGTQYPLSRMYVLLDKIVSRWPDVQARFEAIEAFSDEYDAQWRELEQWHAEGASLALRLSRRHTMRLLMGYWIDGLMARYDMSNVSSTLSLASVPTEELLDLPALSGNFSHVSELDVGRERGLWQVPFIFRNSFSNVPPLDFSVDRLPLPGPNNQPQTWPPRPASPDLGAAGHEGASGAGWSGGHWATGMPRPDYNIEGDGESDFEFFPDVDSDSDEETVATQGSPLLEDEALASDEVGVRDRTPWLFELSPAQTRVREAHWRQLASEPDSRAFFHLLASLRSSDDFRVVRADLTRRVWAVIEAATHNTELRQLLFNLSSTHGTCADGRILTFSGLEVKVFEYQALQAIDPLDLPARGAALLHLSRRLFRLGEVEKLAHAVTEPFLDRAEVRLEYRLGLKDVLGLPGQPQGMLSGRPIHGKVLEQATQAVLLAEESELFYEDLISRDYWVDYLKARYAESFDTLEREAERRRASLEDEHQSLDDAYGVAATTLQIELDTARNQLLLSLSRKEVAALEAAN